jgi:hypothetical protein
MLPPSLPGNWQQDDASAPDPTTNHPNSLPVATKDATRKKQILLRKAVG